MRHGLAGVGRTFLIVLWPAWLIVGAPFIAERLRTGFGPHLLIGAIAVAVAAVAVAYHGRRKLNAAAPPEIQFG